MQVWPCNGRKREGHLVEDDNLRRPVEAAHTVGADLSAVSVEELHERVALLQAEIARLEAEITRKQASREAAASVFRF
jgi:uncharacterized small protein (DUF1192 family)